MNPSELDGLSIASLAKLIERKQVSPVEVTAAAFERIDALNPALNAFITTVPEQALEAARRAERDIAAGRWKGPLHGVPIAHKDVLLTEGVRTTAHSATLADFVPDHAATAVERLEAAGAILMGKLNTFEFACGGTEHFGVPVNPWDGARTTGGSSAGSAASVATGLVFGATGTDTGGSIRAPSSYCGVVGLKPSYGRISRHGVLPLSWSLDHVGPMARTAVDVAIMLESLAGFDAKDPSSSREPVDAYLGAVGGPDGGDALGVRDMRLGVPRDWFGPPVTEEVAVAVGAAIGELERAGAELVPVDLPQARHSMAAVFAIMSPEATMAHLDRLRVSGALYAPMTRHTVLLGACLEGSAYLRGQQARHQMYLELEGVLEVVDALVWPTTYRPAPPVSEQESWTAVQTQLTNLTGHPSVSVPCGFSPDGLPIGLLVTGRMMDEATILRIAAAYQRTTSWHERRPEVPAGQRPPTSRPYRFSSPPNDLDARDRGRLLDRVSASLQRLGLPELEGDVEHLAGALNTVQQGLDAMSGDVPTDLEPLVHQHIGRVPVRPAPSG